MIQVAGNWQKDGEGGGGNFEGTNSKPKVLNFTGDRNPKLEGRKLFSGNTAKCLISNSNSFSIS